MAKKTVKDLNQELVLLKEIIEIMKQEHEEREHKHEEREHNLEARIVALENATTVDTQPTVKVGQNLQFNCKECTLGFENKSELKMHILALHPKNYKCKLCEQIFETSKALECHLKDHDAHKQFKFDLCEKTFIMKWRLRKHQTQHGSTNTRFPHYFNISGFCPYD